jgi:glycerophosphoryl diester phosphodiesterase
MVIFAHRAYRDGPEPERENNLDAVADCLRRGWSVEIDIRRKPDSGGFYISHDLTSPTERNDAIPFCRVIEELARRPVALNIKELGYEDELLRFLDMQGVVDRVFLFDMELLEDHPGKAAVLLRSLHSTVKLAVRASDRREPVGHALKCEVASVVWVDEFDQLWLTQSDVTRMKQVYAISPEIHGFKLEDRNRRWAEFELWGVDGVCTDYPAELDQFIRRK